ncbi:MAG: hypothetical protein MJY68_07385 [Bacteroidaceae bacterium]|nr:hypothetical protein [Bacteroidaceae bacterium]
MKPIIIDLKDYELSGSGKLGESYIKKDNPNILLKLYSTQLEKMGLDEYERACKVYKIGLPCPEPGEQVRTTDGLFPTIKDQFTNYIKENPFLTDDERSGIIKYISNLPDADTAVHGDLHRLRIHISGRTFAHHSLLIFPDNRPQYPS